MGKKKKESNIAFIDGQNLHLGTREVGWVVDRTRLPVYLREKYGVEQAYYFVGYFIEEHQDIYTDLQKAGFIVVFKEHSQLHTSRKKGNVDGLMIFTIMRELLERGDSFDKVVLITGDGDFFELVKYLIEKGRFEKMLFPNKRYASSLYKSLTSKYFDSLDGNNVKSLLEYKR